MPPHRGLEFWTEQIQHYEESGLSQKAFCRNTGLARSTSCASSSGVIPS